MRHNPPERLRDGIALGDTTWGYTAAGARLEVWLCLQVGGKPSTTLCFCRC